MSGSPVLNLFYDEPDDDRWLPFDRFPRRLVRRVVHGQPRVGGQRRVFINLCAGLDRIGVAYRVNEYGYVRRNALEVACVLGKAFVLEKLTSRNPVVAGPALFSHPIDVPDLPDRLPVKRIVVPGPWMKAMCDAYWPGLVEAWPVGIDTDRWTPVPGAIKTTDILLYDKVRWQHESYERSLIEPIRRRLRRDGVSFTEIRYGSYDESDFQVALQDCRAMVFLCEHETQGIAYQQALSSGVPVLAWDRGGAWQDPEYFPDRVVFGPVTSVPYWDGRCGRRFNDAEDFDEQWDAFWSALNSSEYSPRDYILENLTLEKCAQDYVAIVGSGL